MSKPMRLRSHVGRYGDDWVDHIEFDWDNLDDTSISLYGMKRDATLILISLMSGRSPYTISTQAIEIRKVLGLGKLAPMSERRSKTLAEKLMLGKKR